MNFNRFFLWCAGSDVDLLRKCPKSERIKHIGYGTLVIIPAILAFVSMSFALSTMEGLSQYPLLYFIGGLIWAGIIFSFDRFIVSTHRRKYSNREELRNPSFFLRLGFAFILGIVISHPLVLFYFNGSIDDQLQSNDEVAILAIETNYDSKILLEKEQIAYWDSLILDKKEERNKQAAIVASEIDGEVIEATKGQKLTTGLRGKGPSAEQKIEQLNLLNSELTNLQAEADERRKSFEENITKLESVKEEAIANYSSSKDYLKRELALQQLKEENAIVSITQWFLMCLFILVDILPVVFKTFAPFGMYDKILSDDDSIIPSLDSEKRIVLNQKLYDSIS